MVRVGVNLGQSELIVQLVPYVVHTAESLGHDSDLDHFSAGFGPFFFIYLEGIGEQK